MTQAAQQIDANSRVVNSNEAFIAKRTMTFAGGTVNDPGDFDGTGNPATLFTVTGDVLVQLTGVCKVSLEGANATLSVGVAGATTLLTNAVTATSVDANMAVVDDVGLLNAMQTSSRVIGGGLDIIQTVGTANITAGEIVYYCLWRPLSAGASITATTPA